MSLAEKLFSVIAIIYIISFGLILFRYPTVRQVTFLLPFSLVGVLFNIGLLFVVFKDIFSRSFQSPTARIRWAIVIFLFMPAILLYLPLHGFKKRQPRYFKEQGR